MEDYKEHKKGLVGTIVFHTIILLILIFLGFFTPLPLPGEEGILVNFGNSNNGSGDREPSPARINPQPVQSAQKEITQPKQEKVTPPVATPPPPKTSIPKPQPAKEAALTQDYEKTAAIDAAEEKKQKEEKKRMQELEDAKTKKQQENDRVKKIEEDRIRKQQEEAKKIAQEEAERKALAEAVKKKKEEEQRKINEINSRTQGAFANSGSGTGGAGSSDGKSQGATFPGGNQGVPTGDPNAGNYGAGGSGSGNSGSGVSYSLSGRSAVSMPKPKYPGNDAGLVVVKVTVDKNGNVTGAEPGARGTTIMDQKFWSEAKQAALRAKFNVNNDAPAFQQGTISYNFVLD